MRRSSEQIQQDINDTLSVMDAIKLQIRDAIASYKQKGADLDREWLVRANRKLKQKQRNHQKLMMDFGAARKIEKAEISAKNEIENEKQRKTFERSFLHVCKKELGKEKYIALCNATNQYISSQLSDQ